MQSAHGRVDVPWSRVNRLIRGTTDIGLGGGPDVLHDVTGDLMKDGRFRGMVGDSYVLLVIWDRMGKSLAQHPPVRKRTSTRRRNTPRPVAAFAARAQPAGAMRAKTAKLEREYRPGEETRGNP